MIHAASVGEVNAAATLIQALLERDGPPLFVTTFTPTGSQRLRALYGDRVGHAYVSLDLPGACRRLLKSLSPRLLVVMETEIWPNLFHTAGLLGIPVLMINAQISDHSLRSYQRFARITAGALKNVDRVLAAGDEDARRFLACGADQSAVQVAGNIKFDLALPATILERGQALRTAWGVNRPVVVAGSTHEADETVIFEAFSTVLEKEPDALLVLAPRHPERFDAAAAAATSRGLKLFRHSQPGTPDMSCQCLLLDVMGELQAAYGAADIAIIGGSFSDIGGHNPLEAAMSGVAVLTGPDMSGQAEINAALVSRGAVQPVSDANQLAGAMLEILGNENLQLKMAEAGSRTITENRGALAHALDAADELLERAPADARTVD